MAVPPSQDSPPSSDSGSDYSGEPSAGPSQSDHDKYQQPPPSSSTNESSNSGLPVLPWIPSSAVTSHHHYGGLNPENLATLDVVNAVPAPDQQLRLARLKYLGSSSNSGSNNPAGSGPGVCRLLALPSELVDSICTFLSPFDLVSMSAVCHQLRKNALADIHWQAIIQGYVPGCRIRRPYPCRSFMELFSSLDGMWFLPKFKIWFTDSEMPGGVILCRYDQRRGCIEGVRLVAVARNVVYSRWAENESVVIHTFVPSVSLHLERPVLQLNSGDAIAPTEGRLHQGEVRSRFSSQTRMSIGDNLTYSRFAYTKPLDDETAQRKLLGDYPYGYIWPPPTIPAHHHVSGSGCDRTFDYPIDRSEVSDQTFRIWRGIRRHIEVGLNPYAIDVGTTLAGQAFAGERNMTYSTLDPVLYTPTETKPWRGIWVGDYTAHGCEFLLVHQPDDPPATDAELNLVRSTTETDDEWEQRRLEARIYRGRLEAIKLTGDANVPRGEYSFIAHNLGADGLIGIAEKPPFTGARMVHSSGHVAATGFREDKFIETQLFLLSENRLAQYWIEFGFITYYERVNIDAFLDPERRE